MDMLPLAKPLPAPEAFDYTAMDAATADEARAAVERYRGRSRAYVMDTGRDLLAMKARLEHGLFLDWTRDAMGLEPRTAQNFMQAAERFGGKSEIVSHLPPTVLYKLAAPSTPEPVRASVLRRIEAGETIAPAAILDEVREARDEAKVAAAAERETARRAALSDEAREEEDALRLRGERGKAARERKEARARVQRRAEERQERERAREAAAAIVERFGADTLCEIFAALDDTPHSTGQAVRILVAIERAREAPTEALNTGKVALTGRLSDYFISPEDMDEARALAAEIERDGLREPLVVQKLGAGDMYAGRYAVLDGVRRFLALDRVLKRAEIPVRVVPAISP